MPKQSNLPESDPLKSKPSSDGNGPPPKEDGGDRLRDYAKYSGMAFQMGIIILVGTLVGKKLDAYFQLERPYLTIFFALLSIFAALYLVLKDLFAEKK